MNRLENIRKEDEYFAYITRDITTEKIVTLKLTQISATLAMILDAIEKDETSDDGK